MIAQNYPDMIYYYQYVTLPLEYAMQVLGKNHTGLISIQQIAKDPVLTKTSLLPFPMPLIKP